MTEVDIRNTRISAQKRLPTPEEVRGQFPISIESADTVLDARRSIQDILQGKDPRLLCVVGPCSIHDRKVALDYAVKLAELSRKVSDTFVIVMRVYFEKPRTSIGWKGFINDPYLDDTFKIHEGLSMARELLRAITMTGLPVGTEALDPITPQYLDDLVSWVAIGARTVESQTHREMSSGLSSPIGFKNGTDGNVDVAVNALQAVSSPHHFLGIDQQGQCCVFSTTGNPYAHAVLRGGKEPNYDSVNVALCEKKLRNAGLTPNIMIDCSHANSKKDHTIQPLVLQDCINQIAEGNTSIMGFMLESNLFEGRQNLEHPRDLQFGVSITDACLGWEDTEQTLLQAQEKLAKILPQRKRG